jgi:hypothetical protein
MLGVCLVISGDSGKQLVFAHPPPQTQTASATSAPLNTASTIPVPSDEKKTNGTTTAIATNTLFYFPENKFAPFFCPEPVLCNRVLEIQIGKFKFISFPVTLPTRSTHEITFFNVVFVIRFNDRDSEMYKDIAVKLGKALKHEQMRCGFLSNEVKRMQAWYVRCALYGAGRDAMIHAKFRCC